MAALGLMPVQNHPHWSRSPSRVPRAWREVGRCPLGRTAQSIHHHVRAFRDRSIADDSDGQRSDDHPSTSLDATWNIIERAVKRGKARKEPSLLPRIGIDEKAFSKGQKYVSILYNIDNSTVEAIQEGHDFDAAKACFSQLSEKQLQSIQAVAMDMSPAFVRAAKETIPLAENKIVHDRFHIMKMANEAVDKIRRQEHRQLLKDGDDRLKGSKYFGLRRLKTTARSKRLDSSHFANSPYPRGELGLTKNFCVISGLKRQRPKQKHSSRIGISA